MLKLESTLTFSNGDPKNAFGSWGVGVAARTLTYEGRDDLLITRGSHADAFDYKAIPLKDLSFNTFNEYIDLSNKQQGIQHELSETRAEYYNYIKLSLLSNGIRMKQE
jgi:hypothetical protein